MNLGARLGFTVELSFWIMAALLAWNGSAGEEDSLRWVAFAAWLAVVALGLAVHEAGHAFAALRFGATVHVRLHGMGGETRHETKPPLSSGRRLLVTACGPLAGFLLAGAAIALKWALLRSGVLGSLPRLGAGIVLYVLTILKEVCVYWNCFNLLPILPMDGGALLTTAMQRRWGLKGLKVAYGIGLLVGLGVALYLFSDGQRINAVLCASFAASNLSRIQQAQARTPQDDDPQLQAEWGALAELRKSDVRDAAMIHRLIALRRRAKAGLIHVAASAELGLLFARQGRFRAGFALLEPLSSQLNPPAEKWLQLCAYRVGRLDLAISIGERLFPKTKDPDVAFILAAAHAKKGAHEPAAKWLRAATEIAEASAAAPGAKKRWAAKPPDVPGAG
jgi:Zn-dependent protease